MSDGRGLQALLPIPQQIARFVPLPAKPGEHRFLPLEELLLLHSGCCFPGYTDGGIARSASCATATRGGGRGRDLVREFETALKRRRRGEVIV